MSVPNVIAQIPIFGGLIKGFERMVNSSEHNFKSDLDEVLAKSDMPASLRGRIKNILNQGTDEEIGRKLNALMASGLIPPEMAGTIAQLAQQNGVPASSIDPNRIGEPMDMEEIRSILGGSFAPELDAIEATENLFADGEEEASDDDEYAYRHDPIPMPRGLRA